MSRTRRNFSAKLKSDLVLELLKGEKDLNTIASENQIQPNLLRNWKKEFIEKASVVFDDSREENLKNCSDRTMRVNIVRNLLKTKNLPAKTGAELLDVNRTSIYYQRPSASDEDLECKEFIDHIHTDNPAWGARQVSSQFKQHGYNIGRKKTRHYMVEMGIYAIYPKMNLSKRQQKSKVFPYLLKSAIINRPNQAWSIDITYSAPITGG